MSFDKNGIVVEVKDKGLNISINILEKKDELEASIGMTLVKRAGMFKELESVCGGPGIFLRKMLEPHAERLSKELVNFLNKKNK